MNSSSQGAKKAPLLSVRALTFAAMMIAVSYVLYILGFKIAFVPHVTMDFSDLPSVITGLCYGPFAGVMVCFIKNLLHLTISHTMWVGELSNFILSSSFVIISSLIYKTKKNKKTAIIALVAGVFGTAVVSVISNYFIIFPLYAALVCPMEAIMAPYTKVLPGVTTLLPALLIFNFPFTIVKEAVCAIVAVFIYKPVSRVVKGN